MATSAPLWERVAIFSFGVIFVTILLVIAIAFPHPSDFQYTIFRIILALAAAGVAALIPGFIEIKHKTLIRAGGALAVFVIVYFFSPAAIVTADLRKPTDPFKIIVINEHGSTFTANTYDFQMSDINQKRYASNFIALLKQLPGQGENIDASTIFRVADEEVITHKEGDALARGNECVLVVPNVLIEKFEERHLAFVYLRSQLPEQLRCA